MAATVMAGKACLLCDDIYSPEAPWALISWCGVSGGSF
jgi:hypothetical protein